MPCRNGVSGLFGAPGSGGAGGGTVSLTSKLVGGVEPVAPDPPAGVGVATRSIKASAKLRAGM